MNSKISYGLFTGIVEINVLASPAYSDYALKCSYGDNICYFSCQATEEERDIEMQSIIKGETVVPCKTRTKRSTTPFSKTFVSIADSVDDIPFFNATLYLSTLVCLSLTAIMASISAFLAIFNVVFNPVDAILSVFGLYIWNGITSVLAVVVLVIWGTLFALNLSENIAVTDTLRKVQPYSSKGLATLGFSYWLLLGVVWIHAMNLGLLYWRQRLIDKQPPPQTISVDINDSTIILY